jgi:hypothetical protein
MQAIIEIINQLSVLETKTERSPETERSFNRIRQALSEMGFSYSSPVNEMYKDTRTDIEATIIGEAKENLTITKVIKPIVIQHSKIVQRGIVIVESK